MNFSCLCNRMLEVIADIALYKDGRRKKMAVRCCIARNLYKDRID